MTTKNKRLLIGASSVGVLMIATLTVGVIYKMNKTAEYEALLTQQQIQAEEQEKADKAAKDATSSTYEIPPIKSLEEQKKENKLAAERAGWTAPSSAPEITVSTDESGNQTITEVYEKPQPTEEELHNPDKKPTVPPAKSDPKPKDDGVKYDNNGNQVPNEKGQVYVPGFGWLENNPGGTAEAAHNAGTGEVIGY